jgi:hypothetical protein
MGKSNYHCKGFAEVEDIAAQVIAERRELRSRVRGNGLATGTGQRMALRPLTPGRSGCWRTAKLMG